MGEIGGPQAQVGADVKEEKSVEDPFNIVIEIDKKISKYLKTMKVGSLLSVSELISLAAKYNCNQCNVVFYSYNLYKEHIDLHGSWDEIKTDNNIEENNGNGNNAYVDGQQNSNNDPLEPEELPDGPGVESSSGTGDRVSECEACLGSFSNKEGSNEHVCSTAESLQCGVCGKVLPDKKGFDYHMTNHRRMFKKRREKSLPLVTQCPDCNVGVPSNSTLERHRIFNHDVIKKCQECEAAFSTADELRFHERSHSYNKYVKQKYSCEVCGIEIHSKYSLKYHILSMHTPKEELESHICEICGKGFPLKGKLVLHEKNVHGEKNLLCTYEGCSKAFNIKAKLQDHLNRAHLNIRPHECKICGANFAILALMKKHTLIHSDERTCICPFCSKGFKQRATLYRHKKTCNLNPDKDPSRQSANETSWSYS